ncbi:hypothetical protein Pst134EB_014099 [Puccinia striiformis f. sp. tritici]|nr:hypothetical protein Pst134EB_014099 [Puccinia striiformis f. sp. tritici]
MQIFPAHGTQPLPRKRIVTVWFGANDAVIPPKPQMKHASPSGGQQDGSQLPYRTGHSAANFDRATCCRSPPAASRTGGLRTWTGNRGGLASSPNSSARSPRRRGLPVIDTWTTSLRRLTTARAACPPTWLMAYISHSGWIRDRDHRIQINRSSALSNLLT